MREYIEHDGVITNEKNEVIHRFDVGVVRKTPPDAEKSVENMSFMFYDSNFNGNIADWDVSKVENMDWVFENCPLENNKPEWYRHFKRN